MQTKHQDLLAFVRERAANGDFIVLPHAVLRGLERHITLPDIVHTLLSGDLEPSKDEYKVEFHSWNYSVRGQTIDKRPLRIAVAIESSRLLIVTVIRLGRRRI